MIFFPIRVDENILKEPIVMERLWNSLVICILKTNISMIPNMQIILQLKKLNSRHQQAVGRTELKRNMVATNELSIETVKRIVKTYSRRQSTVACDESRWLFPVVSV